MNQQKIRELYAKAMGYTIIDNLHVKDANGNWVVDGSDYNPIDDANQADGLLEYVADGLGWGCGYDSECKNYWCRFVGAGDGVAETQNLAKILCALRFSPEVTDAEIEEALK